jgi:hypothetical protein
MGGRGPVCESEVDERLTAEGWAFSHSFMASMCLIRKISLRCSNCDIDSGFDEKFDAGSGSFPLVFDANAVSNFTSQSLHGAICRATCSFDRSLLYSHDARREIQLEPASARERRGRDGVEA